MHCLTGEIAEARSALERGWYISFSGIVTFNKSHTLKEIARFVPLEKCSLKPMHRILLPFLIVEKRITLFIVAHAKSIAELKDISLEEVASAHMGKWTQGHLI